MTASTHAYRAYLIGTPDVELLLDTDRPGTVTLDDTTAPHVTATIGVRIPDLATMAALDPRASVRVRIEVEAAFPFASQVRSFDLGLRTRTVSHRAGTMTLDLASDEAIIDDWAPHSDDWAPYMYQNSVRSLVDFVLDMASAGALAPGGPDAPIRALTAAVNVVRNPRARTDLADWSSSASVSRSSTGGPAGAPTYVNVQASTTAQLLVNYSADGVPIQAGKRYLVSVWQNTNAGVSTAIDGLVMNAAGATLLDIPETAKIAPAGWHRRRVYFTAPPGATKVQLRSFTTVPVAAGTSLNTTGWRVTEATPDETDDAYFDGDTTDTTEYGYAYVGATSVRTPLIDRAPDLLTWRSGVSGLEFLAPILQSLGLRLVCDEQRVWTLRDDTYTAPGTLNVTHGLNLIDGEDTLTREERNAFDAAVAVYTWRDHNGVQQVRYDSFWLAHPYTQLRTFERDTPYPGPGFAEYAVRRVQSRGREVTVTTVADWDTTSEQYSQYTLPGAPVQVGKTSRVVFDLDADEMTVTSRTADTVPGAIDLLTGTINDLTGTINDL